MKRIARGVKNRIQTRREYQELLMHLLNTYGTNPFITCDVASALGKSTITSLIVRALNDGLIENVGYTMIPYTNKEGKVLMRRVMQHVLTAEGAALLKEILAEDTDDD